MRWGSNLQILLASMPNLHPVVNCSSLFRSGQMETIQEEIQGTQRIDVQGILGKEYLDILKHVQVNVMETYFFNILPINQTNRCSVR